jgi:hypothetical protein
MPRVTSKTPKRKAPKETTEPSKAYVKKDPKETLKSLKDDKQRYIQNLADNIVETENQRNHILLLQSLLDDQAQVVVGLKGRLQCEARSPSPEPKPRTKTSPILEVEEEYLAPDQPTLAPSTPVAPLKTKDRTPPTSEDRLTLAPSPPVAPPKTKVRASPNSENPITLAPSPPIQRRLHNETTPPSKRKIAAFRCSTRKCPEKVYSQGDYCTYCYRRLAEGEDETDDGDYDSGHKKTTPSPKGGLIRLAPL